MKSFLVIGMGRFGLHLAQKLYDMGNDVMVADKNEDIINTACSKFTDSQIGDFSNEIVISSIGVKNFDVCFVCIGEDFQSSLEITSMLKEFGAKHVVSKADTSRQASLLKKIGADEIIYPERDMAQRVAVRYDTENIFEYIPLTSEYAIFEIPVAPQWAGKTIMELDVRKKHSMNVLAIKKDNVVVEVATANYCFVGNEHIVVLGKSEEILKISRKLN